MFDLLVDKTVESRDFNKKKNRDKLIRLTGVMGLFINLLLFIIKIVAGILSGSISIISDSLNNLSDCLTSIVTIFGAHLSAKPADANHPYGHGRSEYLATLLVGLFIVFVGFQLLKSSIDGILDPGKIVSDGITFKILAVSIGLKVYMNYYNKKADKYCDSPLNRGIAADSLNDVIATSMVLLSIIIYKYFGKNIDGYVGLVISGLVIKSGLDMFVEMGKILIGSSVSKEKLVHVEKIILSHEFLRGVHNIEIHEYGKGRFFGSCHVEVPANIDVFSIHRVINKAEEEIYDKTDVEMNIHIDPTFLLEEDHFYRVKDESELEEVDTEERR